MEDDIQHHAERSTPQPGAASRTWTYRPAAAAFNSSATASNSSGGIPLAAGRQLVERRVQHFARIYIGRPTTAPSRRDQRRYQCPVRIRQNTRVAKRFAFMRPTMLCRSHLAPFTGVPDPENVTNSRWAPME